jgi:hypothetical protein
MTILALYQNRIAALSSLPFIRIHRREHEFRTADEPLRHAHAFFVQSQSVAFTGG